MAKVISTCLKEERRILSSACMQEQGPLEKSLQNSVAFERQKNMDNRVGIIRNSVQLMDQAVKYIEDMQDDFDFRYKTLQSRDSTDRNSEMMKQEVTRLQDMLNGLDFKRKEILSKMDVVVKEIDDLVTSQLNPELQDWKRRQQIAAIGGPLLTGLDQLQSWFTLIAQSLFQIKRQLDKLGELVVKVTYECDPIPLQKPQLEERVKYLIYHLIKSSFVVEKQPCMPTHPQKPLIIKTGVQFTTKVRLLVKLPEVDYQLKVKTTFDKDLPPGRVRQFFILTNNTKVMDIEDYSNGCLSVEFRHLGLLSVTEELHSLSFEACFTVQGLTIDLETCSLPLVVISNVSQLPGGWASVMWYNLLTDEPRNLAFFGNPPRATWSQLSEVLSWQFSYLCWSRPQQRAAHHAGRKASWRILQESQFSFWMWLDSILELIKKHLQPVWNENYIMGFVSKEMERTLLKDREPGTFLLRFSESHLGGITFTWVEHKDNGDVKFNSVEPYTKNRLSALPFADIIRDYKVISDGVVPENPLKFLYPDIPKDEAFGRLYNSQPSKVFPNKAETQTRQPAADLTPLAGILFSRITWFVGAPRWPSGRNCLRLDSALQSRVSQLYECRFPREVRHWLCTAIESQDWDSAAVDRNKAMACFRELLVYLEEQWNRSVQEKNILQGPDLPGMRDYLLKHFEAEPISLAIILSECLKEEKKILASVFEAQGCVSPAVDQKWRQLDNKVNELKHRTLETKKEIKSLEVLNEKLDFIQDSLAIPRYDTRHKDGCDRFSVSSCFTYVSYLLLPVEQHNGQSRAAVEKECCKQASFITETNQIVLQQIENILKLAEEIVVTLTDVELPEWKCRQQMACIGAPADTCLDNLQKWFTAVAEVLLRVREQLHKLQEQSKQYNSIDVSNLSGPMAENEKSAVSLLTKLLANALVVEKQPIMSSLPQRPLILKTKVQFTVTVRFLANLPEFKCPIKAKPVFDKDVEEAKTVKGFRGFDFSRADCKVLDVDTPGGGLVAEFGHMSIKDKRNPKSKGTSEPFSRLGVTEELHIIKFVADFQHAGLRCNIEVSELESNCICSAEPVAVRQPSSAHLEAAVASTELAVFVCWPAGAGRTPALNAERKVCGTESAWIWIDGILDLIKKHLVDLWREGFIMGFVNRKRTRALLQEKKTGTFLLRFSESNNDGAITFSWVEHSNGETHVHAVDPCTKQELSVMSLPDIINHYSLRAKKNMTMNPLLYLYPDIDKDVAFGPYYKSSGKVKDGYVVRRLMPVTLMSVSFLPSPPPSPPREIPPMDMDMNMDTDMDINPDQLIQDLFTELTYLQNAYHLRTNGLIPVAPPENMPPHCLNQNISVI
ncbi:Signal transducer and activator of transcription 4 [Larimichthys crocea]|uniref:Uncharacterized protein n=1 Tax=Larimichthys crocea TaxID=215358 RepID=A0ACD3QGS9_LARCR|nr:Signal transducer and activator of transcription 4 [Larimichthys crocea]